MIPAPASPSRAAGRPRARWERIQSAPRVPRRRPPPRPRPPPRRAPRCGAPSPRRRWRRRRRRRRQQDAAEGRDTPHLGAAGREVVLPRIPTNEITRAKSTSAPPKYQKNGRRGPSDERNPRRSALPAPPRGPRRRRSRAGTRAAPAAPAPSPAPPRPPRRTHRRQAGHGPVDQLVRRLRIHGVGDRAAVDAPRPQGLLDPVGPPPAQRALVLGEESREAGVVDPASFHQALQRRRAAPPLRPRGREGAARSRPPSAPCDSGP